MLPRRGATSFLAIGLVSTALLAGSAGPGLAAGSVTWPASAGLLIGEVVTGGASASDEYVEVYNAGAATLDASGLELAYVSASGGTPARKATLDAALAPGAHYLVANAAGAYAGLGDATYTGGLAGDGGTVVLRTSAGAIVDSVSWGGAAGTYVEGAAAHAPAARSGLERLPGGASGNWRDDNDNATDFHVVAAPSPQNLHSAPTPRTGEPTGAPTVERSAEPSPTGSAEPPVETPSGDPSIEPSPSATVEPSAEPSPSAPEPSDEPTPVTDRLAVADARALPIGSKVHVAGVVSAGPGVLGSTTLIAIADDSGGIFVRPPEVLAGADVGRTLDLIGTLAAPYGQLEVRDLEWLSVGEVGVEPAAADAALTQIGEGLEGSLATVSGTVQAVSMENERLYVTIGDGTVSVRVLADPASGITKSDTVRGTRVAVTGIVGQRASATGRLDGYRIWLRSRADFVALAEPGSSDPPGASPGATAGPTLTSGSWFHDLATGLAKLGRMVDVEAVVTASTGAIEWGGPTIVVDDGTAATAVILPAGAASPRVGTRVHVRGKTGSLHSGRRVVATLLESLGEGTAPQPRIVESALGPDLEWRLAQACGRIAKLTRAGSRWRVDLRVGTIQIAVLGEPGSGISATGLVEGRLALVRGIVRRSTSDSGTFVLVPRSAADMTLGPLPAAGGTGGGGGVGTSAGSGSAVMGGTTAADGLVAVSDLAAHDGQTVTVAGLVVATDGETATLDDGTGRVRLGGDAARDALALLEVGDAVEVGGVAHAPAAEWQGEWQIDVDPDRIMSLAGTAPDAAATPPPAGSTAAATPAAGARPSEARASSAPAQVIARPHSTSADWPDPPALLGLVVAVIGLAATVALAIVAVPRVRRRVVRRPELRRNGRSGTRGLA